MSYPIDRIRLFRTTVVRLTPIPWRAGNSTLVTLSLLASLLCGGLASVAVAADRLTTPARASTLAVDSLLLDITAFETLLVAVGERGHILTSTDAGNSWQQAQVPVRVTLTAVQFVTPQQGWAVGHDGVVLHSTDGGRSWSKQLDGHQLNQLVVDYYQNRIDAQLSQAAGDSTRDADADTDADSDVDLEMALDDALFSLEDGPNRPLLDLYFIDQNRGWVMGAYGLLLQTDDGGNSWQPAMLKLDNPDSFHLNAVAAQGDRILISGEAGLLFRSVDQGLSWQRLDAGYEGPFFSVAALGSSGHFLLSGLRGRLFLTLDGGDSWRAIETSTRSTFNAGLALTQGGLIGVGNGGAMFVTDQVLTADSIAADLKIRVQPDRQSYTALIESPAGQLILAGQDGISRLPLAGLFTGGDQ